MMNERIRELAEQAKMFATPMKFHLGGQDYARVRDEKFAELIVRECAEQIIAKGTDWVDFAPSQTGVRPEYWDMAQQIKEHFGVEE
jgi:hypothetical protein